MEKNTFLSFLFDKRLTSSLIIIFITIAIYYGLKNIINLRIENLKDNKESNTRKRQTYLKLLISAIKYIFLVLDLIIVLQIYGVNVTSIIAGLGIVSVISGLALQDALKDIIAGCNIVIDDYFSMGDVVKIDDIEGKIVSIKLKVTKLKDIDNGNIYIIANRNIMKALIVSKQLDIDIPLPYEEKAADMEKIIDEIIEEAKKIKKVDNIKYLSINEFGSSAILYKIRVWCNPEYKRQLKRDILHIIKLKLDEHKVSIPYTQIDVHQKK